MKLRTKVYILLLFIFASCSERVELGDGGDDKLLLECILTQGKEITATLSTVSSFNDISAITYPENARIYILNNKIEQPIELKYDDKRKLYFFPQANHTINTSLDYELRAYLRGDDEIEVIGNTRFESANGIEEIDENSVFISRDIESDLIKVKGEFKMKNYSKNPFYKLKAFYRLVMEDSSYSELIPLTFIENSVDPLAFFQNNYSDGILVDINRVDQSDFDMSFTISDKDTDLEDVYNKIYIQTEAITEAVYRYQVSKSKQINAINSGSSDPVISFTNLNNAYGIFGSSIPRLDSIIIK